MKVRYDPVTVLESIAAFMPLEEILGRRCKYVDLKSGDLLDFSNETAHTVYMRSLLLAIKLNASPLFFEFLSVVVIGIVPV